MNFFEIETKYRAQDIKLREFRKLAETLKPKKFKLAESYDHYFVRSEADFIRFRAGTSPELTMKQKLNDKNNFIRTEVNLRIEDQDEATVQKFCSLLGYQPNFSIFKACWIYWYESFNIVYYIIYEDDRRLKELDRFIEIEMSESKEWKDEGEAWDELVKIEKAMGQLGLSAQARIKKSLFEMFRK